MPAETYVAEELAYLEDVRRAAPSSYVSYISTDTVSKVFYRKVDDYLYRTPTESAGTFSEGFVVGGKTSDMGTYFGFMKDNAQPFSLSPSEGAIEANRGGIPQLAAPADHTGSIVFNRFGPVVACSIRLRFPQRKTGDNYAKMCEFLVVSTDNPALSMGTGGSIVLTGSSSNGISVTCTVSNTIDRQFTINDAGYPSGNIYQFLIRNPNLPPENGYAYDVPVTLTGVIS